MRTRLATLLFCGAFLYGDGSPTAAVQARLTATITPNPMRSPPGPGASLSWNLELRAAGSGSVLVERGYARLVDAEGRVVGSTIDSWSLRIEDGGSRTFNDKQVVYVGGQPAVRFLYTLSFVDDLGKGSTTVEVPVHEFAQASGSDEGRGRRSALTTNRFGAGPT